MEDSLEKWALRMDSQPVGRGLHHWHAKRLGDSLRWSGGFGKGGFEINRMTIYDADFGKNGKDLPARQEILKGLKGTYNTGI